MEEAADCVSSESSADKLNDSNVSHFNIKLQPVINSRIERARQQMVPAKPYRREAEVGTTETVIRDGFKSTRGVISQEKKLFH